MEIATHKIGFFQPLYFLKPAHKNRLFNDHYFDFLNNQFW